MVSVAILFLLCISQAVAYSFRFASHVKSYKGLSVLRSTIGNDQYGSDLGGNQTSSAHVKLPEGPKDFIDKAQDAVDDFLSNKPTKFKLKRDLLSICATTDRGFAANSVDNGRVLKLIDDIKVLNPTENPTQGLYPSIDEDKIPIGN